jgi:hypothetical protein
MEALLTNDAGRTYTLPIYGNSYVTSVQQGTLKINSEGIRGWNDPTSVISTWFAVAGTGKLDVALCGRSDSKSILSITIGDEKFKVDVKNITSTVIRVGSVEIKKPGYVRIDMQGIFGDGEFGTYTSFALSGEAAAGKITAIPKGKEWTYWGCRGPSVHMKYTAPVGETIRYFYNEVTVPEDNDVLNSYYMANGFSGGYMGIQTNEPDINKRRILFSVWSAFTTDDPKNIPEKYRIVMLRKGESVHVGEFGNEGSGGQSYMLYPWEAGKIYRFITEVRPDGSKKTVFTGYFCGHDGVWRLVASFMRPDPDKTEETNYTGMHSFLENFNPNMGWVERKVMFGNQWVCTTDGRWIELTEATFTIDNTGRQGIRLDYAGGVKDGQFYLRNCGFFDDNVVYGSKFERPALGTAPKVDLKALASLGINS